MDDQAQAQLVAARELLTTTRRNIQIVDERIGTLQQGRQALAGPDDISSEHRVAFFSAVDDGDQGRGILVGPSGNPSSYGFQNPKTGIVRVQEDAAFVCTNVLVARSGATTSGRFSDTPADSVLNPWLRFTDANTGRNLVSGLTTGPTDLDRGAVPASYFTSSRRGLGLNVKNKLFSEFTIPRAGAVRVTVFNLGEFPIGGASTMRVYVTLLGYKVFGA